MSVGFSDKLLKGFKMMTFHSRYGRPQVITSLPKMIDIPEENTKMRHIIMNYILFHRKFSYHINPMLTASNFRRHCILNYNDELNKRYIGL